MVNPSGPCSLSRVVQNRAPKLSTKISQIISFCIYCSWGITSGINVGLKISSLGLKMVRKLELHNGKNPLIRWVIAELCHTSEPSGCSTKHIIARTNCIRVYRLVDENRYKMPWPQFNIKCRLTSIGSPYLHNWISYTGKIASIY